jgi:hypothetical protein
VTAPTDLYMSIASDVLCDVAIALETGEFAELMGRLRAALRDMTTAPDEPAADICQARVHEALDVASAFLAHQIEAAG